LNRLKTCRNKQAHSALLPEKAEKPMQNDQNNKLPPRPPVIPGGRSNRLALVFFGLMMVVFVAFFFRNEAPQIREIPYSTFANYLERDEVSSVTILDGSVIEGTLKGTAGDIVRFKTLIPYQDQTLIPSLREKGINISGAVSGFPPWRIDLP
jgi:cell division protease FtsH